MAENGIDPNDKLGIQRFSHFDVSIIYQYLIGSTNLIPILRFFNTYIFDVDYQYPCFHPYIGPTIIGTWCTTCGYTLICKMMPRMHTLLLQYITTLFQNPHT